MAYNITVGSYQTDTIQNFEQAHEIFVREIERPCATAHLRFCQRYC